MSDKGNKQIFAPRMKSSIEIMKKLRDHKTGLSVKLIKEINQQSNTDAALALLRDFGLVETNQGKDARNKYDDYDDERFIIYEINQNGLKIYQHCLDLINSLESARESVLNSPADMKIDKFLLSMIQDQEDAKDVKNLSFSYSNEKKCMLCTLYTNNKPDDKIERVFRRTLKGYFKSRGEETELIEKSDIYDNGDQWELRICYNNKDYEGK